MWFKGCRTLEILKPGQMSSIGNCPKEVEHVSSLAYADWAKISPYLLTPHFFGVSSWNGG